MFVCQLVFSRLVLKEGEGSEYVIAWKSKGLFETELYSLHNDFLHNIIQFRYKIRMKFNTTPLFIDKNNYVTKNCKCLYCLWFRLLAKKST